MLSFIFTCLDYGLNMWVLHLAPLTSKNDKVDFPSDPSSLNPSFLPLTVLLSCLVLNFLQFYLPFCFFSLHISCPHFCTCISFSVQSPPPHPPSHFSSHPLPPHPVSALRPVHFSHCLQSITSSYTPSSPLGIISVCVCVCLPLSLSPPLSIHLSPMF